MKRLLLSATLTLAAALAACGDPATPAGAAPVAGAPFSAGLWRVSIGEGEAGDSVEACLRDPADLRATFERNIDEASVCETENAQVGGGRIKVAFRCTADGGTTRAVTDARYGASMIDGQTTITVQADGKTLHTLTAPVRGQRIGDCPAKAAGQ